MTATYIALATITLTSTDSEIVFSSIPATYRDLVLVVKGKSTALGFMLVRANSDTGNNYSRVFMLGTGSGSGSSGSGTGNAFDPAHAITTDDSSQAVLQFMDYAQTNKHKTVLSRHGSTYSDLAVVATAMRWANTNAINTLAVSINQNAFAIGSSFSLYGIN